MPKPSVKSVRAPAPPPARAPDASSSSLLESLLHLRRDHPCLCDVKVVFHGGAAGDDGGERICNSTLLSLGSEYFKVNECPNRSARLSY